MKHNKTKGFSHPKNTRNTIKRLLEYMLQYKLLWLVVFITVAIGSAASVLSSYIIKPALNNYIIPFIGNENPNLVGFIKLLFYVFIFFVLGTIATWANARIMIYMSTDILFKLRKNLFERLESLPIKYYDSHPHGEIMSCFTNDIDTLRDMLSQSMPEFFNAIITVLSIFVMMLILSPILTALVIITIALIMILVAFLGKKSANAFREQQKNIGIVNGYIEELLEGQRVVKVFNYENEAIEKFGQINKNLREAGTKANTYASIIMPLMGNLSHIQYAIIAIVGAVLVISGKLDLGTIAAFLQYTRNFSRPITMMSQQFNSILNALAGAERIFSVIDEHSEVDDGNIYLVNANEITKKSTNEKKLLQAFSYTGEWAWKSDNQNEKDNLTRLRGEVIFNNVTFGYTKSKQVLHNINIYAHQGQKIALVGSTGSGKTTVINLLMRFYDIDEKNGNITYDGFPINKIKKSSLRQSLGVVLQDTHLFTGTIRENIRYGNLEASDKQIEEAAKLANAESFIKKLEKGYDTVISGDGGNLSQGQRQLLAIARAAVANPPVLILDEATSSIDTRTETLIQKGMDRLMKGRTVFVIAHRLSTVRNADEIIVLEHGNIIERGTHEKLLSQKGRYYNLCSSNTILEE